LFFLINIDINYTLSKKDSVYLKKIRNANIKTLLYKIFLSINFTNCHYSRLCQCQVRIEWNQQEVWYCQSCHQTRSP